MIYFFYGQDDFRKKEKLKSLLAERPDFEQQKIDGQKNSLIEFKNKINNISFFQRPRIFILENFCQHKEQKEMAEFLQEKIENFKNDILIFIEEKINKIFSLTKWLLKKSQALEFSELSPADLKKWIVNYLHSKGAEIDQVALAEFLIRNPKDLWQISNQLDKLLAYQKKISRENVELLCSATGGSNIFQLTDALAVSDKKEFLQLLEKEIAAGAEPIYLSTMIARQLRILLQIKEKTNSQQNFQSSDLARELGLHPFVAQKSLTQSRNFSEEILRKKFHQITLLDLKLKSSKFSAKSLFVEFLTSI